jgi:hypothetical protein
MLTTSYKLLSSSEIFAQLPFYCYRFREQNIHKGESVSNKIKNIYIIIYLCKRVRWFKTLLRYKHEAKRIMQLIAAMVETETFCYNMRLKIRKNLEGGDCTVLTRSQ